MGLVFDHIAVGCVDLAQGVAWVEDRLGVTLQKGGEHDHFGTHNYLLGLGDIYLEVIAKNPDAHPTGRPTWFDLDNFDGPPRLTNWICQTDNIAKDQAITGPAVGLTRGDLHWDLTVPPDGSRPMQGGFPTLLTWGAGITPPAQSLVDSGIRLTQWQVWHPQADWLIQHVDITDPLVTFHHGPAGFKATFQTPRGSVSL